MKTSTLPAKPAFPAKRPASPIAKVIVACALGAALLGLAGCGASSHKIIDADEECVPCHSSTPATVLDTPSSAAKAQDVGTTVQVATKEATVYVCQPVFTDSSKFPAVPVKYQEVEVTDGVATVALDEGYWMLAVGTDSNAKSVLVKASASGETSKIEL